MINDIDEEIMRCIVRCFADDTRIYIKVRTEEDKKAMQEDINKIYKWAEKNIMKFNEKKFEQMTCGKTKVVDVEQELLIENNKIINYLGVGVGVLVGILGTSSNSGGLHFYLRVCM